MQFYTTVVSKVEFLNLITVGYYWIRSCALLAQQASKTNLTRKALKIGYQEGWSDVGKILKGYFVVKTLNSHSDAKDNTRFVEYETNQD